MITIIILPILFFQVAGTQTVASNGVCNIIKKLDCSTFPQQTICASNGVDYPTHCEFAKDHCDDGSIHVALEGACPAVTSPQPTIDPLCHVIINSNCPNKEEQLCGSNGRTYHNLCLLHQDSCAQTSVGVAHKGPCDITPSTSVPSVSGPSTTLTERRSSTGITNMPTTVITGTKVIPTITATTNTDTKGITTMPATMTTETKGITTMTTRMTTASMSTTQDPGLCQAILVVSCGNELDEVCGSDGKAYQNRCEFQKEVCRDKTLKEDSLDKCPTLTNPPTTQTTTAFTTTQTTPDLTITLGFFCQAIVVAVCPPEVKEVCGSDGKTYQDICRFQKAKCYYPNLTATTGACKTVEATTSAQHVATKMTPLTSAQVTTKKVVPMKTTGQVTNKVTVPTATNQVTTRVTGPMTTNQQVTTKVTGPMITNQQVTTHVTGPMTTNQQLTTQTTSMATTHVLSSLCQVIVTLPCTGDDSTCATDGKIYANTCEYSKAKCYRPSLDIGHSGFCKGDVTTTPSPNSNLSALGVICSTLMHVTCDNDPEPVCASNNVTYNNDCRFQKAKCNYPNLTATPGACKTVEATTSAQVTTKKVVPMKTTGHVTTKVTVPMTTNQQLTTQTTSMATTHVLSSLCQVIVTLPCTGDDSTCATDGKIYANTCEYSKAKCYRPSLDIGQSGSCTADVTPSPNSNLSALGVICSTLMHVTCDNDPEPVCASNNVTYNNECEFEKAKCSNENLHVLTFQPCL